MATAGTWNIGGFNLPDFGATELIKGAQQIFQNAGYNQQQGNRSVVSGLIPRALGGTGLVSPVRADGYTSSSYSLPE